MFLGEVPGDLEDRAGHPFVGPAGNLLDAAMLEAGIDRTRVHVTRLHKKPDDGEIRACYPWLREEIRVVKPRVIVALGATVHPSSVLRAPDDERMRARREFVADLKRVAAYLRRLDAKVAGSL